MRLPAIIVTLAIGGCAIAAATGADLFHESFDRCHGGHRNAAQVDTGLALAVGGHLPGWRKTGQGTVHAVDRSGDGDLAAMIWIDNVIELETGIAANDRGTVYVVSFDHGPTVYAMPAQQSAATDGVVVEVVRGDGIALAAFPRRRYLECHRGDAADAALDLSDGLAVAGGGESARVIEPGAADDSLLWQRLAADEMPPGHPLAAEEKRLLRDWIDGGAV